MTKLIVAVILCCLSMASKTCVVGATHPVIAQFANKFRCPYAQEWLVKGPEQAAKDFGLQVDDDVNHHQPHTRLLEEGSQNVTCKLAPGPIGGGHQLGTSSGYGSRCPGTPAEGSPYMWPPKWQSHFSSETLAYDLDEVIHSAHGKVYYMLNKNWKRQDWYKEEGFQRGPGRGVCPPDKLVAVPNETIPFCNRNVEHRQTAIHRGGTMIYINWKEGSDNTKDDVKDIVNCTRLNLGIVGNIRPDWFLDRRGVAADVQYLGNQHLYHESRPRLLKQWRKKDFPSQYFTMSMQEKVLEDGIHWPMILNLPGEGFGDDFIISYDNHSLLTDDDDDIFLLDQAFEAAGFQCPPGNVIGGGPPQGDKIPSNLEVDPNAWYSSEYTYSPFWEPPPKTDVGCSTSDGDEGDMATVDEGAAKVASCYDSSLGAVRMEFSFRVDRDDADEDPWIAVGYRESDICSMNQPSGAALPIILLATDPATGSLTAAMGSLPASARSGTDEVLTEIYSSLRELEEVEEYSNVMVSTDGGKQTALAERQVADLDGAVGKKVKLRFSQIMETPPSEPMYLMYAIGTSPQLGYHGDRSCFTVKEFPECAASGEEDDEKEELRSRGWKAGSSRVLLLFMGIFLYVSN